MDELGAGTSLESFFKGMDEGTGAPAAEDTEGKLADGGAEAATAEDGKVRDQRSDEDGWVRTDLVCVCVL